MSLSSGLFEVEEMASLEYLPFQLDQGLMSKFREDNKHMNQFIVHSSLDIVEEVQWTSNTMYSSMIPFGS